MRRSTVIMGFVVAVLAIVACLVWVAAVHAAGPGVLRVSFLDVGQGDAIFVETPSGRQILIDGGPDSTVLRRLPTVTPWFDRTIDMIVPTHADADHIAGLVHVLDRYQIGTILQPAVAGDTEIAAALVRSIRQEGAQEMAAERGKVLDFGDGARLEILFPDRPLPGADTNTACTITRVVYGKTAFLLPCDAPQAIEEYLVGLDGKALHADVLKAGHHGSKTSSSLTFVGYVQPQWVVYSRGCDNKYGFPHQETIDTFARLNIPTLDTCEEGTITFESDGESVRRK
ncbi:MBL fold metallo-hydrolase [Candidatus Kaiserbacteria bacterium]|nr:MBL fold metallo-hydrolase [Candidatus Kaiserbacteria bacterium]